MSFFLVLLQNAFEQGVAVINNEPWSFGGAGYIEESMNVQKYDAINDQWLTMGSIPATRNCDAIVYK